MIPTECRFATLEDMPAMERFIHRMREGGADYELSVADTRRTLERDAAWEGGPLRDRMLVALEGSEIRARQHFWQRTIYLAGRPRSFVWPAGPVSEGLVNPKYALFSLALLRYSLSLEPLHMSLGLGSYQNTISRIFIKLGWKHEAVPFLFYPARPNKVLQQMAGRYSSTRRRALLEFLRLSGLASLGCHAYQNALKLLRPKRGLQCEEVEAFGQEADDIWEECHRGYKAIVLRNSTTLNYFFPPGDKRYERVVVRRGGKPLGWLLLTRRKMVSSAHFGDLYVGTIADGLCRPQDARSLLAFGLSRLLGHGVDLCVANWTNKAWADASLRLGFLPGVTNFFYFTSQTGSPPLLTAECPLEQMHFNRGDGDGPAALTPAVGETT